MRQKYGLEKSTERWIEAPRIMRLSNILGFLFLTSASFALVGLNAPNDEAKPSRVARCTMPNCDDTPNRISSKKIEALHTTPTTTTTRPLRTTITIPPILEVLIPQSVPKTELTKTFIVDSLAEADVVLIEDSNGVAGPDGLIATADEGANNKKGKVEPEICAVIFSVTEQTDELTVSGTLVGTLDKLTNKDRYDDLDSRPSANTVGHVGETQGDYPIDAKNPEAFFQYLRYIIDLNCSATQRSENQFSAP